MSDPNDSGIYRARRYEVVDDGGHIRAVLGVLDGPDPTNRPVGLTLLDQGGRQRFWVSLDDNGPTQVFDLAGNNIITLGVNDPIADALHVGGYLHVADLDGIPVRRSTFERPTRVTLFEACVP